MLAVTLSCDTATEPPDAGSVNTAPVAPDVSASTPKNTPLEATLPATDADGDPLTFELVEGPSHGTVDEVGAGAAIVARYTPEAGFSGQDRLTYTVSDGQATSDPGTVTITVDNGVPSVEPASAETSKGAVVVVELAGEDPDGDALTFEVVDGPSHGTLGAIEPAAAEGDATPSRAVARLAYTPASDFSGEDTFSYRASDGTDASEPATATVVVANGAPTAASVQATAGKGGAVDVELSGTDPDGDALTFEIVEGPSHGTLDSPEVTGTAAVAAADVSAAALSSGASASAAAQAMETSGLVTYTPGADFAGEDRFTYRVSDGSAVSSPAVVTLTVSNHAPSAEPTSASTHAATPVDIVLRGSDPDGDALDFLVDAPKHGALGAPADQTGTSARVTYTPAPDFVGEDVFRFRVSDGGAVSSWVRVTVQVTNGEPTAAGQSVSTARDAPVTIVLTGTDPDGDALHFDIDDPGHGTLGAPFDATATSVKVTYTPDTGFVGEDGFRFRVSDGTAVSDRVTVGIAVTSVNEAPSFTAGPDQTVLEDAGAQSVGWATGVSAGPGESFGAGAGFSVTANTNPGLFAAGPAIALDGTLTYTPADDANGSADLTVELADGHGATTGPATFTITVTAVNDAPSFTAGPDQTVVEDTGPVRRGWTRGFDPGPADEAGQSVLSYAVSNDNNALFSSQPALTPGGTLSYTLAPDAFGSATVTVSVTDDGGTANGGVDTSPDQTFTITVTAVNEPPSFTGGPDQTVGEDAGPQSVSWATNISAGPGESFGPGAGFNLAPSNRGLFAAGPAISLDGTLTYTPADDAYGSADIAVELVDGHGLWSSQVVFTITVTPVNDAPSFTAGPDQTVLEDAGAQSVSWATDVSAGPGESFGAGGGFSVTANTNPGLFAAGPAIALDGTLTFTSATNASGSADITVELSDGDGATTGPATFTITVTRVFDEATTFDYTGAQQSFTVPANVTSLSIETYGAEGGKGYGSLGGGLGGSATATIVVTPGEVLTVFVGGRGADAALNTAGAGGFNGGAAGGSMSFEHGAGGGGASDVRQGGATLAHRVVVAGGGGGSGGVHYIHEGTAGGAGGGNGGAAGGHVDGAAGSDSEFDLAHGGDGGSDVGGAGGTGGTGVDGADGSSGSGGAGASGSASGGGGGGGYFGGGGGEAGGAPNVDTGGGGGGGSSFVDAGVLMGSATHQRGVRTGHGQVVITY